MKGLEKDPEVLATFREEAYDRLAELEHGVDMLRNAPSADAPAVVHDLFRSAHSLKATANLLGFGRIEGSAKMLEDLLHALRRGETSLDGQTKDTLVRLLDDVGLCIDEL